MMISPSGCSITGEEFSLTCSASLVVGQQSSNIPLSPIEWFFGPNNAPLPSGVTSVATSNGNTYTSTLQFSPLSRSHAGIYTCRLGAGRLLMNTTTINVNGILMKIITLTDSALYAHIFSSSCLVSPGHY